MTAEFPACYNGSFVRVGAVGGGIDCKEKPFCLFLSFAHESLGPDCGLSGEELGHTVVSVLASLLSRVKTLALKFVAQQHSRLFPLWGRGDAQANSTL